MRLKAKVNGCFWAEIKNGPGTNGSWRWYSRRIDPGVPQTACDEIQWPDEHKGGKHRAGSHPPEQDRPHVTHGSSEPYLASGHQLLARL